MKTADKTRLIRRIASRLRGIPEIKLAYLFGSQARKNAGPTSDYDFAFYLDERDSKKIFDTECRIGNILAQELGSDEFDIAMLDRLDAPELVYQIVQDGKLLIDREPYRTTFEPQAINQYEDHITLLRKNHLTRA